MDHNQKGFTLIEMLIVISIIMTVTTISMSKFSVQSSTDPFEEFIQTFEQDIFFMQQQAITYQKPLSLVFDLENHFYYISDSSTYPILIREYHPDLKFDLTSFSRPLRYQTTGIPLRPGSFFITYNQKNYQVIFPFGKGRFYVIEL